MNILAAHLNTSRATEMYLTNLELADIGRQNVVYHIILSSLVLLQSCKVFCIVGRFPYGTYVYRENSTAHYVTVEEQSSNPRHNIIE